ncbi:DUF4232 domain-containing protein [Streptomyces sp. PT12]|uniref:DUF4232 domain-containing protein n=1 Tax=Streptomyces sp. PT12 TaxID=1510197 RepID=UPI000DE3D48F|nr:DUF4232 domain-containing protein [Streptomyces sp. PT12]RBM07349.1 hypothetical protein DEH69_25225 [Streptomyces sp. PT12]
MTSPRHEGGPEPSELTEVFGAPVSPLAPPPGAFAEARRRAAARRRRGVAAAGVAAAVCVAGSAALLGLTRGGDEAPGPPVADGGPAPERDRDTAGTTAPAEPEESAPAEPTAPTDPVPDDEQPPPTTEGAPSAEGSPPATPACASAALALAAGQPDGAAGSLTIPLEFTNEGEVTCALVGYPGVSLTSAEGGGERVGAPARRGEERGQAVPVELAPGEAALADLRVGTAENYPAEDCEPEPAGGLRVFPPDETEALFLPFDGLTACANDGVALLAVTVVYEAPA